MTTKICRYHSHTEACPPAPEREGLKARNMYGCLPCPKCDSKYRAPFKKSMSITCDDCGLAEPWDGTFTDEGYVNANRRSE